MSTRDGLGLLDIKPIQLVGEEYIYQTYEAARRIRQSNTQHFSPIDPLYTASTYLLFTPFGPKNHKFNNTQSLAFQMAPSPATPPVRLCRDQILDATTNLPLVTLTRHSAHGMPSILSSKPFVKCTRASTNTELGTIQFHSLSSSTIDLTIHGRATALQHSGWVHHRWGFRTTTTTSGTWYWKQDKRGRGAKLEDSKSDGRVLARIKGDVLTVEAPGLGPESCDEVLVSAVALAEAVRRQKKSSGRVDLAQAIGEFAASSGGDGGGGGGDGGGGGST
jgi:hypothetical protein